MRRSYSARDLVFRAAASCSQLSTKPGVSSTVAIIPANATINIITFGVLLYSSAMFLVLAVRYSNYFGLVWWATEW